MQMPPIHPHGSPQLVAPASRTKLPDISGHRHHSAPPDIGDEDPFMQGHSKLYVRRREIEAELRREFNLPEEEAQVLRDVMYGRGTGPLMFGRPPPVPKPRRNQTQLPQIPRLNSEPPRARWGKIEDPDNFRAKPQSPKEKEKEDKWWRQEQQELRRQASRWTPEPSAPQMQEQPPPPPIPQHLQGPREGASPTTVRMGRDRPSSWRHSRSERPSVFEGAMHMGTPTPSSPSAPHIGSYPAPPAPAHVDKARELEELAREVRHRHASRQEDERRRVKETEDHEARLAAERRAEEEERDRRRRASEEKIQEVKRQEEKRFEELKDKELKQRRRDAEEAEQRRNEQEEWEREIRKRFKEEEKQRKQQQAHEMAEEAERQSKLRANWDQERADRAQEAAQREREREQRDREREVSRKVEAEQFRKLQEEDEEMQRRVAATEAAERMKRNLEQAGFSQPAPPPPPHGTRGRATSRPEVPLPRRWQPHDTQAQTGATSPSGGHKDRSRRGVSVPAAPRATASLPPDEVIHQAERAAMQQLKALQQLPSKEERQRGFKDLLRAWHPDKNPQNVEVATAVFQRLQAERKKLS